MRIDLQIRDNAFTASAHAGALSHAPEAGPSAPPLRLPRTHGARTKRLL
eukprot:COSAG06_NODE_24155_length_671_cov_0.758741_1_plen_48_part_10